MCVSVRIRRANIRSKIYEDTRLVLLGIGTCLGNSCHSVHPTFRVTYIFFSYPSFLCRQSLTLWREIMHDMFRLWCLGEEDLLSETVAYKLTDTGQGKQRVQYSPRTFKAMQVKSPSCRACCEDGRAISSTIQIAHLWSSVTQTFYVARFSQPSTKPLLCALRFISSQLSRRSCTTPSMEWRAG